jgi:hypothetical protein
MWAAVSYSTNGSNYTAAGSFTQTIKVTGIGPNAWNYNAAATSSPAFTLSVDSFETRYYIMKMHVTRNSSTSSHFSLKAWLASASEPGAWNVQSDGDFSQGSIVLVAHSSDVSCGAVYCRAASVRSFCDGDADLSQATPL